MLCLHGKPVVTYGKKRKSWSCSEFPWCFYCYEEEKPLYDKAIKAFLATKQDRPKCCGIIHPNNASSIKRYWHNYYKHRTYSYNDTDPITEEPPKRFKPNKYLGPYVSAADARRDYAQFMVYTGKEKYRWWTANKEDIGRPFFICRKSSESNPKGCGYFEWGDKIIDTKPLCHHGKVCRIVDGKDGGRFFGCNVEDQSCKYFERITPKD